MTKTFKILAGITIGIVAVFIGYCVYLFSEKNKQRTAKARAARWNPEGTEEEEEEDTAVETATNILQNGN